MKKMLNQNNNQFKKNFVWNLIGTSVNTFTSLFYMVIITRLNGLADAGIFSFAFANAGVLAVIGLYMGRTYQISSEVYSEKVFFQIRKVTCLSMLIISLGMIFIYRYSAERALVFVLWTVFKILDAFSDTLYAVLQKNDRLDCEGKSLTMKAVLAVTSFIALDFFTGNILIASAGAAIASLAIILLWDYPNYRRYRNPAATWSVAECFDVFREGAFICGTTLLSSYLVNASKYAINSGGTDSEQAIYGILVMPATAMNLVGQYLIQPVLMKVFYLYRQKEKKAFIKAIMLMEGVLLGVGLVGVVCAGTIGVPILNLIYGVDLTQYKIELIIVMAGAISYGCATILINILTIMNKNKVQTLCFAVIALIVAVVSSTAVESGGMFGAVMIYFLSMLSAFTVLALVTARTISKKEWDKE